MMEDSVLANLRAAHGTTMRSDFTSFSLDHDLFRTRPTELQRNGLGGVSSSGAKMMSSLSSTTGGATVGATTTATAVHNLLVDMDDQDGSNDVLKRLICEVAEAVVNDEDDSSCGSPVHALPETPMSVKACKQNKLAPPGAATTMTTTTLNAPSWPPTDAADNTVLMRYNHKYNKDNHNHAGPNTNNSYGHTFVSSTMGSANCAQVPLYPSCNTLTAANGNSITHNSTVSNTSAVHAGSFVVEGITSPPPPPPSSTSTSTMTTIHAVRVVTPPFAAVTATPLTLPPPPPPPPPPMYSASVAAGRSPYVVYRPVVTATATPHSSSCGSVNHTVHKAPPPSFDEAMSLTGTNVSLQQQQTALPPSHEVSPVTGARYVVNGTGTSVAMPLDTILLRNDNGVFLLQSISSNKAVGGAGPRVYSPQSNYVNNSNNNHAVNTAMNNDDTNNTHNNNNNIVTSTNSATNNHVNTPPLSPLPRYSLPPSSASAAVVGRKCGYGSMLAGKNNHGKYNYHVNHSSGSAPKAEMVTGNTAKGATFLTNAMLESEALGQTQGQQKQQQQQQRQIMEPPPPPPPPQYCDITATSPVGVTVTNVSTPAITPSTATTPIIMATGGSRACGRNVACNTYVLNGNPSYTQGTLAVRGSTPPYASAPPPYNTI